MGRRAAFHNLGCRVNAYETEAMMEQLKGAGYEIVPFDSPADVYVVNTCTVTNIADRKSRQMLRRAREMNPRAVVVAAGCYAEDSGAGLGDGTVADIVIGNGEKSSLAARLEEYYGGGSGAGPRMRVSEARDVDALAVSESEGRARAFVRIQDGCNQFCTYCVIPFVRGRVRSRGAEEVLSEVRRLAETGFCEVTLSGIHISSYGLDFRGPGGRTVTPMASAAETNRELLEVIRAAAAVPGILRVRLGSLEPGVMTEEFVSELASIPEICPQFHLSLQSGCDATLKRMHRRYTAGDFRRICDRLRDHFELPAITTDVIAGFPGETEEEFRESLAFVREIRFAKTHVFKYSRRRGTKAADMPGQVTEAVKRERSRLYMELDAEAHRGYAEQFIGRGTEVLFEEMRELDGRTMAFGHTARALEAYSESGEAPGTLVSCMATGLAGGALLVKPMGHTGLS